MLLFSEYHIFSAFLEARDRFLKPGGLMFPQQAELVLAPFSSDAVRGALAQRAGFWLQRQFHGIDLLPAWQGAVEAELWKPLVLTIPPRTLVANASRRAFDFHTLTAAEFQNLSVPLSFVHESNGMVHGPATTIIA